MRCFLAVEPDEPARERLARVVRDVVEAVGETAMAFRWVPATNIHVTLHFLGNVELPVVGQLTEILQRGLHERAFQVRTAALGKFPHAGPPKVLWLGIDQGAEELGRTHRELAEAIETVGLRTEDRPFTAHLTLARARDRERSRARRVKWPPTMKVEPIVWPVSHVALIQSDLSGPAPEYRQVAAIPLGA